MKKRTYYTLLLSLLSISLWAQPTADFTVDVTEGCAPLEVNFTNNSTGNGLSYLWDFYDGQTSTEQNPTHFFTNIGSFDICLYVTDDMGQMDTLCMPSLITAWGSPTATTEMEYCENDGCAVFTANGQCYSAGSYFITLPGVTYQGCDSTINLNVIELLNGQSNVEYIGCPGDAFLVNGTMYDENNQSGVEVIPGGSFNGCDSIINVSITFLPSIATDINELLCSGESYTVNGTVYDENNPSGLETLTSYNGCDSIVTISLSFVPAGEIGIAQATISDVSCAGGNDGSICITEVICGQAPYTYAWSNASTANCVTGLSPGTYEVTIHDNNGLSTIEIFTVAETTALSFSNINITNVSCFGGADGSAEVTVSGGTMPYSYSPTDLNNLAAGNYTLTVTDNNACTAATTFTILEPTPIEITGTSTDATCGLSDGSISITIVGGEPPYTFIWSNGESVQNPTNLGAGNYTVTVTDVNGCTETFEIAVNNAGAISTTTTVTNVSCNGGSDGSIDFTVSGGTSPYTFVWNNGGITEDISNLPAGTYTVTVTEAGGCSLIVTAIVEEPNPIMVNANVTNANCLQQNGSIEVFVTGGAGAYTFLWNTGATLPTVLDLGLGTYTLTITDANNCTVVYQTDVQSGLTLDFATIDASCNGAADGAIDLNVTNGTAPFNYIWSNGIITEDLTGLSAGVYVVTVTDDTGCTAEESVLVSEPSPLVLNPSVVNANCNGDFGCIDLTDVTGGCAPYTYLWDNGNTTPINCASNGTFSVTISDCNGCQFVSGNITIVEPPELLLSYTSTCATAGQSDGSITLVVSGGVGPYSYFWTTGATTQDLNNINGGVYSVTVTDGNGCTVAEEDIATNNIIEWMTTDTLGCSGGDTPLFVNAPTAVSYNWEPAAFLSDPNSASPAANTTVTTTFSVTVTNAAGCEDYGQATVNVLDDPVFLLETIDPTCGMNDGSISVVFPCGGNAPYNYVWNTTPIQTGAIATDLWPGVYVVTVTDSSGNTGIGTATLNAVGGPTISISGATLLCEGEQVVLCAAPSGAFIFQWSDDSGNNIGNNICVTVAPVTTSCYELTVTDIATGCTTVEQVCITVASTSDIIASVSPDAAICSGESTVLEVIPSGNPADYSYVWTPSASLDNPNVQNPTASPVFTTVYEVEVIDNITGCFASDVVTVLVSEDCVWPGDTDTNKVVNNFDLLNIGLAFDSIGPSRPGASLSWIGQEAPFWNNDAPNGSNYKHIDCDGNGMINSDDTLAITLNWGEVHNFTGTPDQQLMPVYPISNGAPLNIPFYVQPDTLIEGSDMSLPIVLGEVDNVAEDIYGIAFSLEYDTAFFVPGSVAIGFNASWLGEENNNMITIQRDFFNDGRVDIAMTRTDGMNISDFGQLAQLFITVEDDILFRAGDNDTESIVDDAVFNISNVLVINNLGEMIPVVPMETSSVVETITNTKDISLAEAIHIYPNPAKDRIWVATKNITIEKLSLIDLSGKGIRSTTNTFLTLEQIPDGLYLVKVQTSVGVHVEKVMVKRNR